MGIGLGGLRRVFLVRIIISLFGFKTDDSVSFGLPFDALLVVVRQQADYSQLPV